ncbi:hypothetical protein Tco_0775551 [Tanacetum coccineum]
MESISTQVVAATKLPVLNPNEFELWKMRIEQYFLMTDYALWEEILNGDSPLLTRTIDGVETTIPPTIAEQKLARKNELKARGTLLIALPNEYQLKFNTYKSAKSLMEAIEKRFGDSETLSMDNLYNYLKIYEAEVMGSSSTSQNIRMWLLCLPISLAVQIKLMVLTLPELIIDADDLEEMDLKWQMAMLTMRARRFLNKTGRKINANDSETIGFNKSKALNLNLIPTSESEYSVEKSESDSHLNLNKWSRKTKALVAQDGLGYDWSDQAEEGPTNFALMAYTSSGSSSSSSSDSEVTDIH